jgi:hypothetical protein
MAIGLKLSSNQSSLSLCCFRRSRMRGFVLADADDQSTWSGCCSRRGTAPGLQESASQLTRSRWVDSSLMACGLEESSV